MGMVRTRQKESWRSGAALSTEWQRDECGGAGVKCVGGDVMSDRRGTIRVAVLASGEGTTLQALLDAIAQGALEATIVLVISNKAEAGALRRAHGAGVPTVHLSGTTDPDPAQCDVALCGLLHEYAVDLVVLAGYLKKIGPRTLKDFGGRIINTHPALLPRHGGSGMYGRRVHEEVLRCGDRESGATIHLVDAEYDTGRILAQVRVPVDPAHGVEGLERAVQRAERVLLCETLQRISAGELVL